MSSVAVDWQKIRTTGLAGGSDLTYLSLTIPLSFYHRKNLLNDPPNLEGRTCQLKCTPCQGHARFILAGFHANSDGNSLVTI